MFYFIGLPNKMKIRILPCLAFVLLQLATIQANYPWSQYLADIVSDMEDINDIQLPPNFEQAVFALVPNETLDTERPFYNIRMSAKFTPETELIGHVAHFHMYLFELMTDVFNVPRNTALKFIARKLSPFCQMKPKTCNPEYELDRFHDGSCNNLENPYWGASFTPVPRLLPPVYEDGLMEPRGGYDQKRLPNPRLISITIHYDIIKPDVSITNMVPQIGQFLDHDIALSPEADKRCCTLDKDDKECWAIPLPVDDQFYSTLTEPQTCMDFTRSTPWCFPGPSAQREQFNILTSFLDMSQVYGSDNKRNHQVRVHRRNWMEYGGLVSHPENPFMLPTVKQREEDLGEKIAFLGKYLAGDERVNEMPALTTMHILFFREHNRIAKEIRMREVDWADGETYAHSRRYLIAEWQNIVYSELLPIILGHNTMKKYGLYLDDSYSVYDANVNPTIVNEFSTAAYRFGHTLINGIIQLYKGFKNVGRYEIKDQFFDPEQVEKDNFDGYNQILGGLMMQNSQSFDPNVAEALTNYVLKDKHAEFGSDLIARNIQRGREHGIAPYNELRKYCKLKPLSSWDLRPHEIRQERWDQLQSLYKSPLDIDLFTGGLVEDQMKGALSGVTFNCLMGLQFYKLKYGDRFFFTHGDQVNTFHPNQLKNIRKRTLGDIICDNSDVDMTPLNVFLSSSKSNPQIFCNDPSRTYLDTDLYPPFTG